MRIIILDVESYLMQPGLQAPPYVCAQWGELRKGAPVVPQIALRGPAMRDRLIAWLSDPSVHIVGHNIAFDMTMVMAAHPELAPLIYRAYTEAGNMAARRGHADARSANLHFEIGSIMVRNFALR